jgi:uncharacterized protein YecE (DUF72 family)
MTLTHYYSKQPPASKAYANRPNPYFLDIELLNQFLNLLEPMKDKLGPVMFQFEYLGYGYLGTPYIFICCIFRSELLL